MISTSSTPPCSPQTSSAQASAKSDTGSPASTLPSQPPAQADAYQTEIPDTEDEAEKEKQQRTPPRVEKPARKLQRTASDEKNQTVLDSDEEKVKGEAGQKEFQL